MGMRDCCNRVGIVISRGTCLQRPHGMCFLNACGKGCGCASVQVWLSGLTQVNWSSVDTGNRMLLFHELLPLVSGWAPLLSEPLALWGQLSLTWAQHAALLVFTLSTSGGITVWAGSEPGSLTHQASALPTELYWSFNGWDNYHYVMSPSWRIILFLIIWSLDRFECIVHLLLSCRAENTNGAVVPSGYFVTALHCPADRNGCTEMDYDIQAFTFPHINTINNCMVSQLPKMYLYLCAWIGSALIWLITRDIGYTIYVMLHSHSMVFI